MFKRTFTNSGSIVLRLRMAFGLIFVALVLFGAFSQAKFAEISERKNDLTERAIPLLVQAQELVALLSTQSQQVTTLRDIDTSADFDELAAVATRRRDQFNTGVANYEQLSTERGLLEAEAVLSASTDTLIDLQVQRQALARRHQDQLDQLGQIVERISIQIESLRLNVQSDFQTNIADLRRDADAALQIAPLSRQLSALASLGRLIEQMQDLAQQTRPDRIGSVSQAAAEDIRFVLRQILGLLNRLPATAERVSIATDVVDARHIILDAGGIVDTAQTYDRAQNDIALGVAASFEHIKSFEAIIADTIATADADAQETSALLNGSILSLTVSNLATIATLFGGLILVVVFLVELQLNQRIQSLRTSVRQLSVGNYDEKIAVDGDDELGEVADSLRLSQVLSQNLKRSNADLNSFAYAASHDLKTPLRAITDLAEWTLEDASDELSVDNRKNLVLLSKRSERLSHLLDGLLLYSQLEGIEERSAPVDLVAECAQIDDLLDPDGRFDVVVAKDSDPFSTVIVPVRHILTNLLSNAMKHHDRGSGRIDVGARLRGAFVDITVADDGPGIAPQYHEKIFELFQKLESADVVEGSGIGLALVKKLSERDGGGVWLERNEPGVRGSTFVVRLAVLDTAQPSQPIHKRTFIDASLNR